MCTKIDYVYKKFKKLTPNLQKGNSSTLEKEAFPKGYRQTNIMTDNLTSRAAQGS